MNSCTNYLLNCCFGSIRGCADWLTGPMLSAAPLCPKSARVIRTNACYGVRPQSRAPAVKGQPAVAGLTEGAA
jgi:hypothetical protein